ncbi:hypothetical protein [Streptomyces sp. NPDC019890]|uniref:hypothetical protein n=1 Tax=Streptomyces sp. NPDC019890 TaxID=3365064 RepID=UPI00384F2E24
MTISRKIATGAVSLVSLAAIAAGTAPATAAPSTTTTKASAGRSTTVVTTTTLSAASGCSEWKRAGSLPLKWSTVKDGCGHFGRPGMKMGYSWKVFRGGSICVKVKGFNAHGKKTWYNAGCGKAGAVKVPWGNVLAEKEMQVKGAALFNWL